MKLLHILLLAILINTQALADQEEMSKQEFTQAFLAAISAEIEGAEFTIVSDLNIRSESIDGYKLDIFLGNAYDVYTSGQKELTQVFGDQIRSIKNHKRANEKDDLKSILPVLKPRDYIETATKQLKEAGYDKDGLPFYFEDLNPDICVLYVFDSPDSMRFVSPEDIEKHHIRTSVRNIAIENVGRYYSKFGAQIRQLDTGGNGDIYLFVADENYEASVLLVDKILDKEKIPVKGDIVVFIPARSVALIAGSEDTHGMQIASNLAKQGYKELGYAISPFGYIKVNGKWRRFKP
jgi:uncharacterized protein YtpQ (UPF0354 family)